MDEGGWRMEDGGGRPGTNTCAISCTDTSSCASGTRTVPVPKPATMAAAAARFDQYFPSSSSSSLSPPSSSLLSSSSSPLFFPSRSPLPPPPPHSPPSGSSSKRAPWGLELVRSWGAGSRLCAVRFSIDTILAGGALAPQATFSRCLAHTHWARCSLGPSSLGVPPASGRK